MRSSATAGTFGAFSAAVLAGAAVLVFHTAAFAQQAHPAAKDKAATDANKDAKSAPAPTEGPANQPGQAPQAQPEMPPGYAPPPGYGNPPPQGYPQPPVEGPYYHDDYYGPPPPPPYGYPPPRYYRRYAPPPPMGPMGYYPEPLHYRPFFFGFGLGVSGLAIFPNQNNANNQGNASRVGLGYDFRFGFGISPRWSLVLAADGATAYFDNDVSVSETVFTVGPQVFLTPKLYLRAGVGAAARTYDYGGYYDAYYNNATSDSGFGGTAAVGFEFVQSYHVALALEAGATLAYYPNKDTLSTYGINFVLNLF